MCKSFLAKKQELAKHHNQEYIYLSATSTLYKKRELTSELDIEPKK